MKRGFKMKIKYIAFLVLVLLFSYQNCSRSNFTDETSQQLDSKVEGQSLADLQVQQLKFFTEQNSEMQKGSHKFYVKTKLNYVLDPESGVLAEHDEASGDLKTYCLSHELLADVRSIFSRSSVCRGGPSATEACAQVIQEPYAEVVTSNDVIQLGAASDACGSNKIDLCEDQSSVLRSWIDSVRSQLPQLTCSQ